MALNCTAQALLSASECLGCGMTHKQLLAALVYIQCKANNMDCTPATLNVNATQLREKMTEKQLLAALVYIQCINNGGGGGGGGTPLVTGGAGVPVADPGIPFQVYTDTNTGNQFFWYGGAWH